MGLTRKQRNWLDRRRRRRRSKLAQSHQIQKKKPNITLSLRKEESQHTRGMQYFCNNVALAENTTIPTTGKRKKELKKEREEYKQTNQKRDMLFE